MFSSMHKPGAPAHTSFPAFGLASNTTFVVGTILLNVITLRSLPGVVGALVYLVVLVVQVLCGSASRVQGRFVLVFGTALGAGALTAAISLVISPESRASTYQALSAMLAFGSAVGVAAQTFASVQRFGSRRGMIVMMAPVLLLPAAPAALIAANPWKFWLAVPITVLLLAATGRRASLSVAALAACAVVGFANDARSVGVLAVAAALLVAVQRIGPLRLFARRRRGVAGRVVLVVALTFCAVAVGAQLALGFLQLASSGILGREIQEKQIAQAGGSTDLITVIVGARAEVPVSLHLLQVQPLGFGIGVIPSDSVVYGAQLAYRAAISGNSTLADANPAGVVSGSSVVLHSELADVWYSFGLGGVLMLVLGLLAGGIVVAKAFARGDPAYGLVLYLYLSLLNDVLFSPLRGNYYNSALAFGLAAALSVHVQSSATGSVVQRNASDRRADRRSIT